MQQPLARQRVLLIAASLAGMDTANGVAALSALLPKGEFDVHVCLLDSRKPWTPQWLTVSADRTLLNRHWRFDPLAFHRLRRLVRTFRPHIVHAWDADALTYAYAAMWPRAGIPKLLYELDASTSHFSRVHAQQNYFERSANHWVAATHVTADQWQQRGVPTKWCTTICRAIQPAPTNASLRAELLSTLGVPGSPKLIAAVGPIERHLRWKEMIWAIDQLKAVGCPAHLLLVGDGPYREALARYVRLNRVTDRVHFLGHRPDWRDIINAADLLWHAAPEIGDRIPILYALSAGVPVVAVDAVGIRNDLITHGVTGFITPAKERAGIARWSLAILEDAALARRLGEAGRAWAQQQGKADEMVSQYVALYRKLISGAAAI